MKDYRREILYIFVAGILLICIFGCQIPKEIVSATQKTSLAVQEINKQWKNKLPPILKTLEAIKPTLKPEERKQIEEAKKFFSNTGKYLDKLEEILKKLQAIAEKYGEKNGREN